MKNNNKNRKLKTIRQKNNLRLGITKFYCTEKVSNLLKETTTSDDYINRLVEIAKKSLMKTYKLKLGKITAETSNPASPIIKHVEGEPVVNIRVIRIPIIENGNEDEEFQHELHVGNGTAKRILRKMGFEIDDDEYVFSIPAKEIIKRANWAKGNEVDFDDDEIAKIFKNSKVNFYSGASNEADNEFIDTLVTMSQYAIKNGYDTIVGS